MIVYAPMIEKDDWPHPLVCGVCHSVEGAVDLLRKDVLLGNLDQMIRRPEKEVGSCHRYWEEKRRWGTLAYVEEWTVQP